LLVIKGTKGAAPSSRTNEQQHHVLGLSAVPHLTGQLQIMFS